MARRRRGSGAAHHRARFAVLLTAGLLVNACGRLGYEGSALESKDAGGRDVLGDVSAGDGPLDVSGPLPDASAPDGTVRDASMEEETPDGGCERPRSFELRAISSAAVSSAVSDFDSMCSSGGSWCSGVLEGLYEVPACVPEPVTLEQVTESVLAMFEVRASFGDGTILDRTETSSLFFFTTAQSSGGPALLDSLDTLAGDTALQAWHHEARVPCHNCTEYEAHLVVYYTATRKVVFLSGTYGYDS